jgi:hypothetical protein
MDNLKEPLMSEINQLRQESEEIRVRSEKIMIDLNYSIQKN